MAINDVLTTETPSKTTPTDLEETNNPYSNFNLTRHMYETKLANIFSDYEKSQNYLQKEKRESLQDAYFIKEMSKKYLGEYASNTGVGNVSGELSSVYSDYQKNVSGIRNAYSDKAFALENEYLKQREQVMGGILESQYGMKMEEMQKEMQSVWFDVIRGNTEGLGDIEYLDKALKDGRIDEQTHMAFVGSLMDQNEQEMMMNIESGFYGFRYEDGKRVLNDNPMEYIEQNKSNISAQAYRRMADYAELTQQISEATELQDVFRKNLPNGEENPNYIGEDYMFELMVPDVDVDPRTTIAYADSAGNKFFSHKNPVDKDDGSGITSQELFDKYFMATGEEVPESGHIQQAVTSKGAHSFVYNDGKWYRLGQEQPISEEEMRYWRYDSGYYEGTDLGYIHFRSRRRAIFNWKDKVEIGNKMYKRDKVAFKVSNANSGDEAAIKDLFLRVHGENGNIPDRVFVYYKGEIYSHMDGDIHNYKRT